MTAENVTGLETVVLGVREGTAPSSKPPVRMFVATEPAQYRAERIFLWSIEQVRDPGRVYEINLMKGLQGFDNRAWLTGFTNYRFAIPELAGGRGRCTYNDVDQVFLEDPAELFDTAMGEHGFLTVPPQHNQATADTSVMLLDCERMVSLWNVEAASTHKKNQLLAMAKAVPGLRGDLVPGWNDCDDEYRQGHTKVLHFTIIHTQPWRPFPETFAYQRNPVADLWLGMERAADAAGYQPYGASHPSAGYTRLMASFEARPESGLGREASRELLDLIKESKPASLLDWGLGPAGSPDLPTVSSESGVSSSLVRCDAASGASFPSPDSAFSGALCTQALDWIPAEDIPWVLEELFRCATGFVFCVASDETRAVPDADASTVRNSMRTAAWWFEKFRAASVRHPKVHWRLCLRGDADGGESIRVRCGGPPLGREPRVWILSDGKPGHTTQSLGLAEALGWPWEIKELRFGPLASLQRRLNVPFGKVGASLLGLDSSASDALAPPWPDVVIATGWRPAPVARWIAEQSRGHTRLVHMGRQGAWIADPFDAVVTCSHFGAPPHEKRIETLLPLHRALPEKLAEARRRWPDLFGSAPHPHVLLLVGGSTRRFRLDPDEAHALATEVRTLSEASGGSVFAVTSRRTGIEATKALEQALGGPERVHRFGSAEENPYLGYLAAADAIVVTGESESMLGEALASGAPVYIHPLREQHPGWVARLQDWVVERSQRQPLSRRGRVRPQQGVEYFCARLIERGLIPPRRDLNGLHQRLIDQNLARPLGEIKTDGQHVTHAKMETDEVALELLSRLALGGT